MGRTDDVINVRDTGCRPDRSKGAGGHPAVAECAVIGSPTRSKARFRVGSSCQGGRDGRPAGDELIAAVRENIGAVACSGLSRRARGCAKTVGARSWQPCAASPTVATTSAVDIEDPAVLDALRPILRA